MREYIISYWFRDNDDREKQEQHFAFYDVIKKLAREANPDVDMRAVHPIDGTFFLKSDIDKDDLVKQLFDALGGAKTDASFLVTEVEMKSSKVGGWMGSSFWRSIEFDDKPRPKWLEEAEQ